MIKISYNFYKILSPKKKWSQLLSRICQKAAPKATEGRPINQTEYYSRAGRSTIFILYTTFILTSW